MTKCMRTSAIVTTLGLLSLAACRLDSPGLGNEFPHGIIQVFAEPDGEGGYVARPRAEFVLTLGSPMPDSRTSLDSCSVEAYTSGDPGFGTVPFLSAGEQVQLSIAGTQYSLMPRTDGHRIRYELPDGGTVPVQPGQVLSFSSAGAQDGFPGFTISSPIGPAFTAVTPIAGAPEEGEEITVNWAPVGDDSSKVELSLRYAAGGVTTRNSQVLCDWVDDGANLIPESLLTGWRIGEAQQIELTRYRTKSDLIGDATLFLLAVFDTILAPAF